MSSGVGDIKRRLSSLYDIDDKKHNDQQTSTFIVTSQEMYKIEQSTHNRREDTASGERRETSVCVCVKERGETRAKRRDKRHQEASPRSI